MTPLLDYTLELAVQGVRFFRVIPNQKTPAIGDFSHKATSNRDELIKLFDGTDFNSGIACGKIREGLYLVGFDIDDKDERHGFRTIERLKVLGKEFPDTWSQKTPSGGEHRLYWSPIPIRQGTNVCGDGIDLRGDGGYLVGPGSRINGRMYEPKNYWPTSGERKSIALFPDWAIEEYRKQDKVIPLKIKNAKPVTDQILALKRSIEYLQSLEAVTMGNRNNECYKVCCRLKDLGLDADQFLEVLAVHWKCEPMLEHDEINQAINSAFNYSKNSAGVLAPENLFQDEVNVGEKKEKKIDHPFIQLNKDHFYVASEGVSRVCWETTRNDRFHLERFPVHIFHEKNASKTMILNGRQHPITKLWMESKERRTYDFIRFDPSCTNDERTYNTWKGFAVRPAGPNIRGSILGEKAVDAFLEHCLENICGGDHNLNKWLLGFFAHIFQHPGEKPQVALVFKGSKGSGKSALIERLNFLIGESAVIISDKAHMSNHFNSIMEDKLLFTMDEAFWSGDKSIEGILKTIITGQTRVITRKGSEPYTTKVYDRIVIIGNEEWLVPATADERRFAVFNVSNGKRMNAKFFVDMKEGIEKHGGAELLMRFFMDYDLSKIDINVAPDTIGLREQKENSLNSFELFWKECLTEEYVLNSGFDNWPETMACEDFYDAFLSWCEKKKIRYPISKYIVGKMLRRFMPEINKERSKVKRFYTFPPIEIARMDWENYIGHSSDWDL